MTTKAKNTKKEAEPKAQEADPDPIAKLQTSIDTKARNLQRRIGKLEKDMEELKTQQLLAMQKEVSQAVPAEPEIEEPEDGLVRTNVEAARGALSALLENVRGYEEAFTRHKMPFDAETCAIFIESLEARIEEL